MPLPRRHLSPVVPRHGAEGPVPADAVTLTGGFWHERQRLTTDRLLDHADRWITSMGWYDAFTVAAGGEPGRPLQGKLFTDADVYKLLEAFAWEVAARPDPVREARLAELGRLVASAQQEDGYLNTFFSPKGREARYSDLADGHELYCAGHLMQAAVARMRSGVEDELTGAARRLADRICEDFGEGGILGSDGHPEIEVAMVELGRATGEARYVAQARRFVESRGTSSFPHHAVGPEYYLDDVPVREATVLRGHVVRAMYLTAGVVDLAVETGDDELLEAARTQWRNTWARRTYLTGGMGARHLGESFGEDFELPPDRAYTETCGAVGAVMVAHRLLLATGEAEYADAVERLLFNMVAAHPNAEGDRFFYVNPLLRREPGIPVAEGVAPFRKDTLRASWFWVACCPTNVVRLLASLSGYLTTATADTVTVQQYFSGEVTAHLEQAGEVRLRVETDYPWSGTVRVTVVAAPDAEVGLRLRVPGWAAGATLDDGSGPRPAGPGYAEVRRRFAAGDTVELALPLEPRVVRPDQRIAAVRGSAAVERGPLVFCAEFPVGAGDDVDLDALRLDPGVLRAHEASGPSDVRTVIEAHGHEVPGVRTDGWPYAGDGQAASGAATARDFTLIPYYAWSNRGPSTMRVWLPLVEGDR